jgi:hypothetical protein
MPKIPAHPIVIYAQSEVLGEGTPCPHWGGNGESLGNIVDPPLRLLTFPLLLYSLQAKLMSSSYSLAIFQTLC